MEDLNFRMKQIGARIRKYRKSNSLSMKELAEALEISVPYLSQIENGKVNINVLLLYEVVKVLNIASVTQLVTDFPESRVNIILKEHRKNISHSEHVSQDFLCATPEHELEVSVLHIAPGGHTEKAVHHQGDELCYVLRGHIRMELNDGMEEYNLGPDDAAEYSAMIPHRFHNIGEGEAEIILAVSPVTF